MVKRPEVRDTMLRESNFQVLSNFIKTLAEEQET